MRNLGQVECKHFFEVCVVQDGEERRKKMKNRKKTENEDKKEDPG